MANTFSTGGGGGGNARTTRASAPFSISGAANFVPYYHPQNIVEVKERTPSREANFCDGEDVADNGSKNREMQIMGKVLASETSQLTALGDADEAVTMVSELFKGEVYVQKVKKKTISEWDPFERENLYGYTISVLSSGLDEGHTMSNGIIQGGSGGGQTQSSTTSTSGNVV